jgi:effector-binding domain-containing protein
MTGVLAIYHDEEFDPNDSDLELAIEIKEAVKGTRDLETGLCAVITHKGPYSGLVESYAKVVSWIEKEGYAIASSPFDLYLNDPDETKPEDLITEIYFPVKKK